MIEAGDTFDGYRIDEILGQGGMGVVYEATQLSLGRKVALKILRPELAADPGFATRLGHEGALQASIEHANVLDVYEVGESPHGLYLAMRLVRGVTLSDLIQGGELRASQAIDLLGQAADALDAAHAAGLVHRDVKPRNILVSVEAVAYLADFGLTRAEQGEGSTGPSRRALGTIAYVAPEVIGGAVHTPAADRYAFAATIFQCLTGDVVFPKGSDAAILYAHTSEEPPDASKRRPELPGAVGRALVRGLAKDPAKRPASARALVDEVKRGFGSNLRAVAPPDVAEAGDSVTLTSSPGPAPRSRPVARGRWALPAVAVAAALAGAGVMGLASSGGDDSVETAAPAPEGTQPLGSTLEEPDASVGCDGKAPDADSIACAVAQADLPDATLLVPSDGIIESWAVRGASGDIALDVIRPRGDATVRIARSQWEYAGNGAPFVFGTAMPVEKGDLLALELGPGASIGVRDTDGATTQRWLEPVNGSYGNPDQGAGTGFDREILLRADFRPGGTLEQPPALTGVKARRAPVGNIRDEVRRTISKPDTAVNIRLVEVGDRVALDLIRGGEREVRMYIPDLVAGGSPIALEALSFEGQPFVAVSVSWVNPNTGRLIFHGMTVTARSIEYLG